MKFYLLIEMATSNTFVQYIIIGIIWYFWDSHISPVLSKIYLGIVSWIDRALELDEKPIAEKIEHVESNAAKIARIRQELEQMKRHQ